MAASEWEDVPLDDEGPKPSDAELLRSRHGDATIKADHGWEDVPLAETPVHSAGPITAAIRGGINAATLGHMDEIAGAMEHPIGATKALLGRGSDNSDVKLYQGTRDKYRKQYAAEKKEHPWLYGTGGVAGAVLGPGKILKGLKGVKAVATAAALGGAQTEGEGDAELADKEYGKEALNIAPGAIVGGGMQAVLPPLIDKVAPVVGRLGTATKAFIGAFKNKGATAAEGAAPAAAGEVPTISDAQVDNVRNGAKSFFSKAEPAQNSEEILKASQEIGGPNVKVPNYMLTRDQDTRRMADTVLNSSTLAGRAEQQTLKPLKEGLDKFSTDIASQAGNKSAYQTGEEVKSGIKDAFAARVAPAEQTYNELESEFGKVPINGQAFKRAISAMKNEYAAKDYSGKSTALLDRLSKHFADNIDSVDSLRQFRTALGSNLDQSATPAEKQIISRMYDVLTRERNRSILRYEGNIPAQKGILAKLRQADDIYRKALTETSGALGVEGTRREGTRSAINSFLSDTGGEDVVKKLFDKGDVNALRRLQAAYPEQFEILKKRALGEVVEKAKNPNGILSPQGVVTNLGKHSPEVQQMILGDQYGKAQAAKTVLGAIPQDANPSGTAKMLMAKDFWSPKHQIQMAATRSAMNAKAPSADMIRGAIGGGDGQQKVLSLLQNNPQGAKFAQPLMNAMKRGDNAFGATYFLLNQQYPEFRKMLQESDEKK